MSFKIYKAGVWRVCYVRNTGQRWNENKETIVVCATAAQAVAAVLETDATKTAVIHSVNRCSSDRGDVLVEDAAPFDTAEPQA